MRTKVGAVTCRRETEAALRERASDDFPPRAHHAARPGSAGRATDVAVPLARERERETSNSQKSTAEASGFGETSTQFLKSKKFKNLVTFNIKIKSWKIW